MTSLASAAIDAPVLQDTGSRDLESYRLMALLHALTYPALYFVTSLEDPTRYEPLWQFQLVGVLFFGVVLASVRRGAQHRTAPLFHGALFVTLAWTLGTSYYAGYGGRRMALNAMCFASAMTIRDRRVLGAYLALLTGGTLGGIALRSELPRSVGVARVLVGLAVVGLRIWAYERVLGTERRFRQLLLASPVPTVLLAQDVCQLVNHAARQLLGLEPGDRLSEVLLGEVPWWQSPRPTGPVTIRVRGAGGEVRQCEVSFAPVEGAEGLLQVVLVDRTADLRLLHTKDVLIAAAVRELREPLATLRQSLARWEALQPPGTEAMLMELAQTSGQLEGAVADLGLIKALERRELGHGLEEHPALAPAEQAQGMLESAARLRDVVIALENKLPAEGRRKLRTELHSATLALAGVLTYALGRSPRESVIEVTVEQDARGWVHYRVQDQGPWIPEQFRGRLFGPFYTLVEGVPDSEPDGVGLAIARLLVDRLGGTLRCTSAPREAVVLTLSLPGV